MKTWLTPIAALALAAAPAPLGQAPELEAPDDAPLGQAAAQKKVYVVPVRDDIMPPILYVIRRGVKEAMAAKADCLILDMETNGGRVDITEEIFDIIGKFSGDPLPPNQTVTYVNKDAYSAGAFIAVATQKIYMAPQSVIGAAAPIMMSPTGGVSEMPSTMEVKINSAIRAKIRTQAEKNGYAIDVIEAMVDKTKKLERDGKVICEVGDILTLTNREAEAKYGEAKTRLLSSGTVESIDELIKSWVTPGRSGSMSCRSAWRNWAHGSTPSARSCCSSASSACTSSLRQPASACSARSASRHWCCTFSAATSPGWPASSGSASSWWGWRWLRWNCFSCRAPFLSA